jgi:hypothetical protein
MLTAGSYEALPHAAHLREGPYDGHVTAGIAAARGSGAQPDPEPRSANHSVRQAHVHRPAAQRQSRWLTCTPQPLAPYTHR